MSEENFTNRHGRTFSVPAEDIELQSPKAESQPEPKPKPLVRRKRKKFRFTKELKIFLIVLAVIFVGIPILVGEYVRSSYTGDVRRAKTELLAVFNESVEQQKGDVTSESVGSLRKKVSAVNDGLCPVGFFDNIAKIYPRSVKAYEDCSEYRSKVASLDSKLGESVEQLKYLEKLQPILGGVNKPLEDRFAVLAAQQENWQVMVNSLKQMSVPAAFSTSHDSLVFQAETIRDQWTALVQASSALDSAKFVESRGKITEAYTKLSQTVDEFSAAVNQQQKILKDAVTSFR